MATIYELKIGKDTIHYSESNIVKMSDTDYNMSLLSLRYHKKMYQPSLIEAKLQLRQNTSAVATKVPDMNVLIKYFKTQENNVSLSKSVNGQESIVAKNYYVYKVIPEYIRGEQGNYIHVTLHIYSPDHKLTLDKYCRSYTNKKLADDIFTSGVTASDNPLSKAGFTTDNIDAKHLKFLRYVFDVQGDNVTYKEFVQPYLVQYNESFYDFMARTANRCGEFFYYEQGTLYLGINDFSVASEATEGQVNQKDHIDIDRDKVLSYRFQQSDDSLVAPQNYYYNSLIEKKDNDKTFSYNNELPLNEYLGNIVKKDEFTDTLKEFFPKAWKCVPEAFEALSTGGVGGLIGWLVPTVMMGTLFAKSTADAKNKLYNDTWVNDSEPTKNKNNYADRYDKSSSRATLYGTMMTQDVQNKNYEYNQNLNDVLYNFIGQGSRNVSSGLIDINIGVEQTSLLLGQSVTFESMSAVADQKKSMNEGEAFNFDHYVVIEVTEVIKSEFSDHVPEDWQVGQKVTVAPLYHVTTKKCNDSTEQKFSIACPPVMCPLIRKSGSQRAFVSENVDPMYFGRVRIKYPWQSGTDDSSPFIRIAVPYAPETSENGGGFYFQPRIGTEVLVGYENDNIERPYVIGSLFNEQAKAPHDGGTFTSEWTPSLHPNLPSEPLIISSLKGHKIKFNDNGNAEDFVKSVYPGADLLKFAWKQLPEGCRIDQGMNSCFSGGVTITDKWGMYKIDCNTNTRTVAVNSPFGEVKLNAFTGITINAPNGDINIKGKNVTISAGNELKLQSGGNISKPEHSFLRDTILMNIAKSVTDINLKLIDLSFLRDVLEMFLAPVAGTMTIKSNRYLLLGAGQGMPEIPRKAYTLKGLHQLESKDSKSYNLMGAITPKWYNDCIILSNTIRFINAQVDSWFTNLSTKYQIAKRFLNNYASDPRQALPASTVADNFWQKNGEIQVADISFAQEEHNEQVENELLHKANNLKEALDDLKDYCIKLPKGDLLPDDKERKHTKYVKEALKDVDIKLIKDLQEMKHNFNLDEAEIEAVATPLKRMIAYYVIEHTEAVEQRPEHPGDKKTFKKFDDFKNDVAWYIFINNLKVYKGGKFSSFVGEALEYVGNQVINRSGWRMVREHGIWSAAQNGEILFSDKRGDETLNFSNGGLNHSPNENGYLKQVMGELATL